MRPVLSANQLPFRVWLILTVIALSSFRGFTTPPAAITAHPVNTAVCPGSEAIFSVTATDVLTYQWRVNTGAGFEDIVDDATYSGATTSQLTISAADISMDGYQYECAVTGTTGPEDVSNPAIVNVADLVVTPTISDVTCFGETNGSISLSVTGGSGTYSYFWLSTFGSSDAEFNLAAGDHTVLVTDATGCGGSQLFTVGSPTQIVATETVTNVSTTGGSDGAISLSTTGGAGTYTYSWAPDGETTSAISGKPAGTYTCTITDVTGCPVDHVVTIVEAVGGMSATTSKTDNLCFGGGSGTATVSVSGGTAPYTYLWSNGETTATIIDLEAGTYTVTITDATLATITESITLVDPTPRTITKSGTDVTCFGASDGTATVVVSGGTAPYDYVWVPGVAQFTATAVGLAPGSYTCNIFDANGCGSTRTVVISGPTQITATTSQTNNTCAGGATGSATVVASGGAPGAYTYSWSPSGGTAATATGLAAGTYNCSITDATGCSVVKTFTILDGAAITVATTKTDLTCFGDDSGTAGVTPSGGVAPYTYAWSNGEITSSITDLPAGVYTCVITAANGCSASASVTVNEPPVKNITKSSTNVTCFGANDGTATVLVTGGTPPYDYVWVGGVTQYTATATNLAPGVYTCNVYDANGCGSTSTVTITQPTQLAATTSKIDNTCAGGTSGSATVVPSGGTAGYTYSWSPSGGTAATASNLAAGAYTCTITDGNGCTITRSFTITAPPAMTVTQGVTNVSCAGGSNGAITLSVTGGAGSYTYNWTASGNTTNTETGLAAGVYQCVITDNNSCTVTVSVTVNQPAAITYTSSAIAESCAGSNNGSATVNPSGGTPGYTYLWSPSGQTTQTATGLAPGTYTCTITDANSCTSTATVIVGAGSSLTASVFTVNVSCAGGSNGAAGVTPAGGLAPYTYAWSSGGTSSSVSGLSAGTYTCTITSANGCSLTESITITEPAPRVITKSGTNVTCFGASDGTASVVVSGGTPPYTYVWVPGSQNTATATGLAPGSYTCNIFDANGCGSTRTVVITGPTQIVAVRAQTNVACSGASTGSASVSVSGGTGSYTYSWSPSGGTAATASGLAAGTYVCTVTDGSGCSITESFTITQNAALAATQSVTAVSCFGGSNGAAIVSVTGGTGSYTYSWSPSGGTASGATGLAAGAYTCTITDAAGCSITRNITITQPPVLAASVSGTNVSCFGAGDGSASVTVTGGTLPYSYNWTPGAQTTSSITGLAPGTYTYTVTDGNGCTVTGSRTVTSATQLVATISKTDNACYGGTVGEASVAVTGGSGSYTYLWSTGGTAAIESGLPAGTYSVTVTDLAGCSVSASVTITEGTAMVITSTVVDNKCAGASDGTATVGVTGGLAPYTYSWSSGGTANVEQFLAAGTYQCTITGANGCSVVETVVIGEPAQLTAVKSGTNITCYGANDGTVSVVVSGGTAPYFYNWFPGGQTTATATGLAPGSYTCTVYDANGCGFSRTVAITGPTQIITTTTQVNILCNGAASGSASVSATGGTGSYTYNWLPSGGTGATATALTAGTYTVTVTDGSGCSVTQTVTLTQPTAIAITGTVVNASCVGIPDGSVSASVTGGTGPYTYSWSPSGGTGASATGLTPGSYTVTVTDANGCSASLTQVVGGNPLPSVNAVTGESLCNNSGSAGFIFSGSSIVPTTYNWSNNDPSIGLAAYGTGNISPFTVTNPGSAPVTATITVIPEANGCSGAAQTFTIQVRPTASVNPVSDMTICLDATSTPVVFSGPVASTTYTWTNSDPGIGLAASGTGDIPAFTATNTTSSALTATISVIGQASGCAGTAQVFTITVNLPSVAPTGITVSESKLCGPGQVNLSVNGGTLGTGAQWKWYSASCGGTLVGTGATLTNVNVTSTTTFYVRAEGVCNTTTCVSTTVTVNPQPVITLTAAGPLALQPGMTTKLTGTVSPAAAGDVYTWYRNGVVVAGITADNYTVNIDTRGTYTIKVTSVLGCEALSNAIVIRDSVSTRLYCYPNPNNGHFKVRHYSPSIFYGKRHLTVYTMNGQLVYKKEYTVSDAYTIMDVNIAGVAQGTYIVILGDAQNRVLAKDKIQVY